MKRQLAVYWSGITFGATLVCAAVLFWRYSMKNNCGPWRVKCSLGGRVTCDFISQSKPPSDLGHLPDWFVCEFYWRCSSNNANHANKLEESK